MIRSAVILLALLLSSPALADDRMPSAPYANVQLEDPAKEAAAQDLMLILRCLQCQGQSIADSDAKVAGDMRNQVRLKIEAGETPEQIRIWLVERYGDYVSFEPRLTSLTWPLFAAPALLLGLAFLLLRRRFVKGQG